MSSKKIGIIAGSVRKGSFSKYTAEAMKEILSDTFFSQLINIESLSIYNQDLDTPENTPESWTEFREQASEFDAFIFITPEYNRSVPPILKNAIDIGSRPYKASVWDGKPAAVISISLGSLGGFGANHHLRQSLVFLNMPVLQQPEAYIGNIHELFDKNGKLTNDDTKKFLQDFANAFINCVNTNTK